MKKKYIITIQIILITIIVIIIILKLLPNKNTELETNNTKTSLINKLLDVEITHEDKNIKINDFTELNEFYLFNLTNNSNENINFELLKIEFFDKNKKLLLNEELTITIEKNTIQSFQIRKNQNTKEKVKYIKLTTLANK